MSKAFWAQHSIKGSQGKQGSMPDKMRARDGVMETDVSRPDSPMGGSYGPASIPVEAATPGLAARAKQLNDARQTQRAVSRTSRALGTNDDSASNTAQRAVDLAESGYERQAKESIRRVAKRKS